MKDKLNTLVRKHWHKAFIGGHLTYFAAAFHEGNSAAALVAVLIIVGALFHLGGDA